MKPIKQTLASGRHQVSSPFDPARPSLRVHSQLAVLRIIFKYLRCLPPPSPGLLWKEYPKAASGHRIWPVMFQKLSWIALQRGPSLPTDLLKLPVGQRRSASASVAEQPWTLSVTSLQVYSSISCWYSSKV